MKEKDVEKGMIEWVWDHYGRGEILVAMDESLKKDYDEKQVECLMIVGLWCAHPDVNLRPSFRQAIQVLNFEVLMPNLSPKRPVATSCSYYTNNNKLCRSFYYHKSSRWSLIDSLSMESRMCYYFACIDLRKSQCV
jgi:hypothetical protein